MQSCYSFHNIDLEFGGRILLKAAELTLDRKIGLVGRNELARFLLNAEILARPVAALSGGERVRG